MSKTGQSRVVGLLGVGFDHRDEIIRITQAGAYQILMGSGETHQELQKLCRTIDEKIKASGRSLNDYSPEEFMGMLEELY